MTKWQLWQSNNDNNDKITMTIITKQWQWKNDNVVWTMIIMLMTMITMKRQWQHDNDDEDDRMTTTKMVMMMSVRRREDEGMVKRWTAIFVFEGSFTTTRALWMLCLETKFCCTYLFLLLNLSFEKEFAQIIFHNTKNKKSAGNLPFWLPYGPSGQDWIGLGNISS